jgi:RNA polymerase sigma factor (sigma-70 family)
MSIGEPFAERKPDAVSPSATREGHAKALGELYLTHHRQMLRILSVRTGSRHAAEEILHEAYAKMLELDRPQVAGFLRKYVWKCIWNLLTDGTRREVRRARLDAVALLEPDNVAPSAEAVLVEQERLDLLEEAIDNLRPKELEAFVLKAQQGLTYQEVAVRMGISVRMVKYHVSRALKYCHKYQNASQAARRAPK